MKLLLAEDTQDLNRVVTALLEHEGYLVDSVFDGLEAMERLEQDSYDGVILDIMMPRMDGISVLQQMRQRHILTPVLLLTAKAEVDDRVAGLDAGADDYLPKPFAMKELAARVRAMTRRYMDYSGEELQYGDLTLSAATLALTASNSVRLSIREYELMQMLMCAPQAPLTTEQILSHVWKSEPEATADTAWLYVSYLRGKLRAVGSRIGIDGERGGSFCLTEGVLS